MTKRYLGMRSSDLADKGYARFWNPRVSPLAIEVCQAIAQGPVAELLLAPLSEAARVFESGESTLDNGFCLAADGSLRVATLTQMPRVSPSMIDWWFGWHSDEPQRYKLWHPQAHVFAEWRSRVRSGATGRERYVGRTSCVDEYIGHQLGSYAIQFVAPESLGLNPRLLADPGAATAVCARVGFARIPLDFGWLIHYVVGIEGGSAMRSRFWVGGPHTALRVGGFLGAAASRIVRRFAAPSSANACALLAHCSQEMSHLATFLPQIYQELA
jgi:DAPG hydrolase PhiG domain